MNTPTRRSSGFTLIELLVVIVLLGILVGLFVPSGGSSTTEATRARLANQGRNIVVAMITENMCREAGCSSFPVWPTVGEVDANYSNSVFTASSTSNDYFAWLIGDRVVESLDDFGLFAGDGIAVAPNAGEFRTRQHNVWNVVANLDWRNVGESSPVSGQVSSWKPVGDPPFLFTRNFHATPALLRAEGGAQAWTNEERWNPKSEPFGRSCAIVVTYGAVARIIPRRAMTRERFVGSTVFSAETNKDVVIWYAVGAERSSSARP